MTDAVDVEVVVLKEEDGWYKCPRCWHYTHEGQFNFNKLCDRCSNVMVSAHPDHPWVPEILKNKEEQRAMWTVKPEEKR